MKDSSTPAAPASGFSPEVRAAIHSASAERGNPARVVEAFTQGGPIPIAAGVEIRTVTMATYLLLEKIQSPLVSSQEADGVALIDIGRALVVLTKPVREVREILAKDRLDDAAFEIMDCIRPSELSRLGPAISAAISSAFQTVVGGGSDEEAGAAPGENTDPLAGCATGAPASAGA
jgi:hypothetical protein